MNILYFYNSAQTYVNTVYEHINAFNKYSRHRSFFCHVDSSSSFDIDLNRFDAVVIHYTIRLPFNQVSEKIAHAISGFSGLKVLFIQDEYDHTYQTWHWIKHLGIQLVFTVVPEKNISTVYPPQEFPGVSFISNLTGYVPDNIVLSDNELLPPSKRTRIIGYRGRPLPVHYGQLGQEKAHIGKMVKEYCDKKGICNDIAWTEEERIYGNAWYEFMSSCRGMLGSESGCNVVDWDGTLGEQIMRFKKLHPSATEEEIYKEVISPREVFTLMNQVSPRIFEAIASHTSLVLFEGNYSGVVQPWEHYIPLKKDGSNLDEVFTKLQKADFVDTMVKKAYEDVIESGKYSYENFIFMVDGQIETHFQLVNKTELLNRLSFSSDCPPATITTIPVRSSPSKFLKMGRNYKKIWSIMPQGLRELFKPSLQKFIK